MIKHFYVFSILLISLNFNTYSKSKFVIVKDAIKVGNVRLPQVTDYPDKQSKNKFNVVVRELGNKLRCLSSKKSIGAFWLVKSRISYAKDGIISFKVRSSYNCDSLHFYEDIDNSLNYDLVNNRKLFFSDLVLPKEKSKKYLRKSFSKGLDQACINKVSFYLDDPKLFSKWIQFHFDYENLFIRLNVPYSLKECRKDLVIPFNKARKRLKMGSFFDRIVPSQKNKTK